VRFPVLLFSEFEAKIITTVKTQCHAVTKTSMSKTAAVLLRPAARLCTIVGHAPARQLAAPALAVRMMMGVANATPIITGHKLGRAWQGRQWLSSAAAGMVDVEAGERAAVTVTEGCAKRILKVQPHGFLRLRVDGGGCSGFQYKFELDSDSQDDDVVFERSGAKLVIDETSLDLVRGSTIDFVEEMISSSFQVSVCDFVIVCLCACVCACACWG